MEQTRLNANARAVLDVLQAAKDHPTALEIYERVRQARPHIGVATVYRILHQLTEQGMIRTLGREGECRYDAHIQRHDHAICVSCGALLDLPVDVEIPNAALRSVAQMAGIELDTYEVRIYGRCQSCQLTD
ncbi:MAG: transcriptional repressor [Ktedonobacteraceae bacterium]|nr:transcriptional repressor [Ktedonobacteraceae bacterium]